MKALELSNNPNKIQFGFWYSEMHPQYPMVVPGTEDNLSLLTPLIDIEEQAEVLQFKGSSPCRVCGCSNGSRTFVKEIGGVIYEWPEGLIHYLSVHHIEPPAGLLQMLGLPYKLTANMKAHLESEGYFHLREVKGVICGLHNFLSTCGLVVGLTTIGYERRYCFPFDNHYLKGVKAATEALDAMTDSEEHAIGNWIKCKGRFKGVPIDLFNPEFIKET